MTISDETRKQELAKRKAWVFTPNARPRLADVLAGGERRQAFMRYWVKGTINNAVDLAVHFGLKLMPMDTCSDAGARIGLFAIPRWFKAQERRARATLRRLLPEKTDAEIEALFLDNCRAQGRLMTEFSIINRLIRHPERIVLHDFHNLFDTAHKGPVIIVGMHLGNWEIGPAILRSEGIKPYANYTPPAGRAKAWISSRVRTKTGLNFLPPGHAGVRPSLKVLKSGGAISMFCDEGFKGVIRGPLFGRAPHAEGNLAVAVRLSRMTGAPICVWYNIRKDGFRFEAFSLPPITLPPEDKPGTRLLDDIALLNSVIEPVIRANLDQWYFLDNALPGA